MIGWWLACAALLCAVRPASADEGTARAAFRQAEDLRKAGKWGDACPLYAASYHDDPQLGVLLHLAECHEKVGMLASAWLEFNDAAELAKQRHDPREADAKSAADALVPRLAKLHVTAPARVYAGLVVKRDGVDMTVLVGTDAPIDPGEYELVASAPGFVEWKTKIKIAGEGKIQSVTIPALVEAPQQAAAAAAAVGVPAPPAHDGAVTITASRPDARISIDQKQVGVGSWHGRIATGGHTLRVEAPGAHAYQSEILVDAERERTIDVPLELEPVAENFGPRFEIALSFAPGVKLNTDDPTVFAYRGDLAVRLGRRLKLGAIVEYGEIKTGTAPGHPGVCGTDFMKDDPSNMYSFHECTYGLYGLKLDVHLRPLQVIDPFVGIGAGIRLTQVTYDVSTTSGLQYESMFGIFGAVRSGLDYHPIASTYAWSIGAYAELQFGAGKEQQPNIGGGPTYASVFVGIRTAWAFL